MHAQINNMHRYTYIIHTYLYYVIYTSILYFVILFFSVIPRRRRDFRQGRGGGVDAEWMPPSAQLLAPGGRLRALEGPLIRPPARVTKFFIELYQKLFFFVANPVVR